MFVTPQAKPAIPAGQLPAAQRDNLTTPSQPQPQATRQNPDGLLAGLPSIKQLPNEVLMNITTFSRRRI